MAVREYIGARYVPKFMGLYDPTEDYEALCVVDNGLGTSYISKVPTPAGTPLTDTNYWIVSGDSNGAIIQLQEEVNRIKESASISDMQSNTDLVIGDVAHTSGFYAAGDGGAGTYLVDNVGSADGMFNIGLSNGLIAHLIYGDNVNILQLGAHKDGSTDDTLIIQTALNNARHITIPTGTYLISSTLTPKTANVIVGSDDGFDRSRSVIKTVTDITMFNFANGSITVDDIVLEHEASQTAPVTNFTGAKYIKLKNVKFNHGTPCTAVGIWSDVNSADWCGYLYFDTVYCSDYYNNVKFNATECSFFNCKMNGATSNNIVFDGEIMNLISCDLRSNSDIPPVKYSGTYGVNMSGCYNEHIHNYNLIEKSEPFAYVKNNGCKCTWGTTSNTFGGESHEGIFDPVNSAAPDVLPRFKDGTDGDSILVNGAFDFGKAAWSIDADANAVVQDSDCSGYAKELYCQFSGGANIRQVIVNLPKGTYTLSFWAKIEDAPSAFYLDTYVSAGTGSSSYYAYYPIRNHVQLPNGVWKLITVTFDSPNDPGMTNLNVRIRGNATVTKLHLTGICLTSGVNAKNVSKACSGWKNVVMCDRLHILSTNGTLYWIDVEEVGGIPQIKITPESM